MILSRECTNTCLVKAFKTNDLYLTLSPSPNKIARAQSYVHSISISVYTKPTETQYNLI